MKLSPLRRSSFPAPLVAPDVWKRAAIGSRSNCVACHTRADKGDFDEDNVRIPQ